MLKLLRVLGQELNSKFFAMIASNFRQHFNYN
jgi:hypothetical protein